MRYMANKRVQKLYQLLYFHPTMLSDATSGVLEPTGVKWEIVYSPTTGKKNIRFSFRGDPSPAYVHDISDYIAPFLMRVVYSPYNGSMYYLEVGPPRFNQYIVTYTLITSNSPMVITQEELTCTI